MTLFAWGAQCWLGRQDALDQQADMRQALLLMLTGLVQLDAAAYQQAGGNATFASLVHNTDPRIRYDHPRPVTLAVRPM